MVVIGIPGVRLTGSEHERTALPFISTVQALFLIGAVFALDPLLGVCGLVGLSGIWFVLRWYLRRARTGYLAEGAANSEVAEIVSATASGARTVEALRLERRRIAANRDALETSRRRRFHTLFLRTVFFPSVEVSYFVPLVMVLLLGGVLVLQRPDGSFHAELAAVAVLIVAVIGRISGQLVPPAPPAPGRSGLSVPAPPAHAAPHLSTSTAPASPRSP